MKDIEGSDVEVMRFVLEHPDVHLVHLYPAIPADLDGEIEKRISAFASVRFRKEVRLTRRGLINCKRISYGKQGDWIGSFADGWSGLRKHAKKSIRGERRPTRVYIVTDTDLDRMKRLKAEIREMLGKGTWPCHITDTHEEAVELAGIYFNRNSLQVTNGRSVRCDNALMDARIDELKRRVKEAGLPLEGIIGVGSTPLCVAGVRRAKDFDFLALTKDYDVVRDKVYSPHDSQLKYYPYPKDELIADPGLHFHYRGMKFISLEVLLGMKKKRHEWPKDFKDMFRLWFFGLKTRFLLTVSPWRWFV